MMLMITFGISEIFVLLFGILIGLVMGTFIFIKRKHRLIISHVNKTYRKIPHSEQEKINKKINSIYTYHVKSRKTSRKIFFGLIKLKKRVDKKKLANDYLNINIEENTSISFTNELYWLINEVAKIYYPDSKMPLYELSIDEVMLLSREIIKLTYNIIIDLGIPNLEKMTINQLNELIKVSGKITKIYNIKGIKVTVNILNVAIKIQSILTPIYWIKTGTNILTISSLSQFVTRSMFEIIAKETANIYSKNFTNK